MVSIYAIPRPIEWIVQNLQTPPRGFPRTAGTHELEIIAHTLVFLFFAVVRAYLLILLGVYHKRIH